MADNVNVVVPEVLVVVKVMLAIAENVGACLEAGLMVAVKSIVPVNPLSTVAMIVRVPVEPLASARLVGLTLRAKSGAWMVMVLEASGVV